MAEINKSRIIVEITCPECGGRQTIPISDVNIYSRINCHRKECKAVFKPQIKCLFDDHTYPDISPDAFMHPLDRKAIGALRTIPGFDFALRKMMEYGYEKILRVNSMADDVKVSTKTFGYMNDMVLQAAGCLGISAPDVFINQDPIPNAFTFGIEYPIISIQSGIIELLTEEELYAVIAHEMTHIKCHHVLYHMLADFLVNASAMLGFVGGFIIPLNLALLEWSRKAELSADRGALVVTNNKDAIIKLMMKLAGGSSKVAEMIDEHEFVSQAKQFEEITKGIGLNKFYRIASNLTRNHPFPALRAYEINNWADGDEYQAIYQGEYKRRATEAQPLVEEIKECPHCKEPLAAGTDYCVNCGQNTKNLKNQYDQSGYQYFMKGLKGGMNSTLDYFSSFKNKSEPVFTEKICPDCHTKYYDPDMETCPVDGQVLIAEEKKKHFRDIWSKLSGKHD